jgi:predicted hotdog family 3-hydroxylacyl-ACP dehydratase
VAVDIKNISVEDILPHKGDMVLIHSLLEYGEDYLTSCVDIKKQILFKNANGEVPSWIGMEYMAQTIGAFAGVAAEKTGGDPKIGFLISVRQYKMNHSVFTSDQKLRIHVKLTYSDSVMGAYDCTIEDYKSKKELVTSLVRVYQPEDVEKFLN